MKFVFIKIVILFSLVSCTNINFLLDEGGGGDFLKNKTSVYISGWNNPIIKEIFFLKFGETSNKRFLLTAKVSKKQTKRYVNVNQVAKKIDYKITVDYALSDINKKCTDILNSQTSRFSFTPKSSGFNFASDVLFDDLLKGAVLENLNNFVAFANNKIQPQNCLNED
tara:strand:- start:15948 stop:16448 length:501 start_codon:yes stop_codon:yes gene_type:complete